MKKFLFAIALLFTACSNNIDSTTIANIVATGAICCEADDISEIAEMAGRENITVCPSTSADLFIVKVNEVGRNNCATFLY